jgi:hypothetical protein
MPSKLKNTEKISASDRFLKNDRKNLGEGSRFPVLIIARADVPKELTMGRKLLYICNIIAFNK